jgi:hypothetical protein
VREKRVKTTPMIRVVNNDPNSVYSVASLLIHDLEGRQQILSNDDIAGAITELSIQLVGYFEEE